eukprot:TRINITY_DN17047_c1_g2_i2.p1 TRINITY_DN17047_c1_g2~~TRINITY_DN17047_c1_g2_i2.p1  ORF type:complete len:791 (+),score=163.22 TRINITY_DN17047_c1_g2_i2:1379-3751(+)
MCGNAFHFPPHHRDMWSKGDSVVITGDVDTLKKLVLAMPDDLEWSDEYHAVVGKQGTIIEVEEEGYADVDIGGETTSIPFKALSSPPATIQAGNYSPSTNIDVDTAVSITSEKRLRRALKQHKIEWTDAHSNACEKKGKVVQVDGDKVVVQVDGESCTVPVDAVFALKKKVSEENGNGHHIDPVAFDPSILDASTKRKSMCDESLALAVSMRVVVCSELELKKLISEKNDMVWDVNLHPQACGKPGVIKKIKQYLIDVHIAHTPHTITIPAKGLTVVPPLSVGVVVVICPSRSNLKKLVEMHPDDLIWDEAVYKPILGRKGSIVEIDEELVDVDIEGLSVTIPAAGLSEHDTDDMSPKHLPEKQASSQSPPPASTSPGVISKGSSVVITASKSELKKLISQEDEDDIMWDDESHATISGKKATVVDIDGRILDVELLNTDVVSVPASAVTLASEVSSEKQPTKAKKEKEPSPTKPSKATSSPPPVKVGAVVSVVEKASVLQAEIAKYPDDLEWDPELHRGICGKKATVLALDEGVADLNMTDTNEEVSVPQSCVSPFVEREPAKKIVQPKVVPPVSQKKPAVTYKEGMSVQICNSKSELKRIIARYPDDVEWDELTHAACLGVTGMVIGIDDSILDIKTSAGTVSVPSEAVTPAADTPKEKPKVAAPSKNQHPPGQLSGRFFLDDPAEITRHFMRLKLSIPRNAQQMRGKPVRLIKQLNPNAAEVEWEGGTATVPMAVLQIKNMPSLGSPKSASPPPLGAKSTTPGPYSNKKPGSTLKKVGEAKGCCIVA